MGILRRNAGKLALIALIVFFSLPFIYGNEEEEDFSPFAVKAGLSYQANPISKLANRIASFYGLPKSNLKTTGERVNFDKGENIRNKVSNHNSFNKGQTRESKRSFTDVGGNGAGSIASNYNAGYEQYFEEENSKKGNSPSSSKQVNTYNINNTNTVNNINTVNNVNTAKASAHRGYNSVDKGDPTIYEPAREGALATSATSMTYSTYNKPKTPVTEYVEIDGKSYEVIKDITGKRFVATAKGHIPYEEVMRNTVSEQEFRAAKKRLVNASDAEIIQYVLEQKQAAAGANNSANTANTYRDSYSSRRTGTATTMGGTAANIDKSISTDIGFDESMFNELYEGLRNYRSGGDISNADGSAAGGSVSSSNSSAGGKGSSSGNYRGGSNNYRGVQNTNNAIIAGVNLGNINRQVTQSVEGKEVSQATVADNKGDDATPGSMSGKNQSNQWTQELIGQAGKSISEVAKDLPNKTSATNGQSRKTKRDIEELTN